MTQVDHAHSALATVMAFKQFQAAFYEECEVLNYDDLRSLIITMLKPRSCRLPMSEVGLYTQLALIDVFYGILCSYRLKHS